MIPTVIQQETMVRYWQHGHPPLEVDGDFGPQTQASVEASYRPTALDGFPLNPTVNDWEPAINKYRGNIPLAFHNNWLGMESGGNNLALGIPGVEAGPWQTYHPDDDHYGQTFAELRVNGTPGSSKPTRALTYTEAYEIAKAGCAYVQSAYDVSKKQLAAITGGVFLPWTERGILCMTKLRHNLPVFGGVFLPVWAKQRTSNNTFADFNLWVRKLSLHDFAAIAPHAANFYDSRGHLFDIAEKCGTF